MKLFGLEIFGPRKVPELVERAQEAVDEAAVATADAKVAVADYWEGADRRISREYALAEPRLERRKR